MGTPARKYRIHHDDKRPGVLIEGTYYLSSLREVLWHDGRGMRLFGKRLERGHFIWPSLPSPPSRLVHKHYRKRQL